MRVHTISTPELGDRSYLVHDGEVVLVVDPQRDLDRIEAVVEASGLAVGLVVETHLHNDYVTGGHALARRTGARYAVAAADEVAFERCGVSDGDRLEVGRLQVDVIATPGHTDTHLAYSVRDAGAPDEPGAVFSGGSLLYGSVGRTDLVDPARAAELAGAQHRSAHRLARLPGPTVVYPTHGFGSFCSGGQTLVRDVSTLAEELVYNDALVEPDEAVFVRRLLAGLGGYPTYYAHMAEQNRRGPGAADLRPRDPIGGAALTERLAGGGWVVDLRDRASYAAGHVAGTVGIELGDQLATYLGWTLPWGEPLTLLADGPGQLDDATRQLARIGIDGPDVGLLGDPALATLPRRSYRRAGFDELAEELAARPTTSVLDVRDDRERAAERIPASRHIPLAELDRRIDELPVGDPVWVHCLSGFRASIAAGLLDRAGHEVVLVDDDLARGRALRLLDTRPDVTPPREEGATR